MFYKTHCNYCTLESGVLWYTLVIPTLSRLRPKLKDSLGYIVKQWQDLKDSLGYIIKQCLKTTGGKKGGSGLNLKDHNEIIVKIFLPSI